MTTCGQCNAELRPGLGFCINCGAQVAQLPAYPAPPPQQQMATGPMPVMGYGPPPRDNTRVRLAIAAGVAAVVLVAAIVTTVFVIRDRNSTAVAGGPIGALPTQGAQVPLRGGPTETQEDSAAVAPPAASTPTDDSATSAEQALDNQVATDSTLLGTLEDTWVPQLSSKSVGLVADGITYGYPEIWSNYQSFKQQHPEALLLRSGDYSTFKNAGYYVVVIPYPSATGDDANAWCDSENIDADNCFAKLISHTAGSDGATTNR
jgi:hypothetical protein